MKFYLWTLTYAAGWETVVLWDGESTYWHDGMVPSKGYKRKTLSGKACKVTKSKFIYIGEL